MTATTKRAAMLERIERHGRQLLAIFPSTTEKDPVKLCKVLRRIEVKLNQAACDYCNGGITLDQLDAIGMKGLTAVMMLLYPNGDEGNCPQVHFNRDPRGYALKIQSETMHHANLDLHRDWGGYGIIAPDLSEDS